jgi:hypothetical protein
MSYYLAKAHLTVSIFPVFPLLEKQTKVELVNKMGEENSPHDLRHVNTRQKKTKWARTRAGYP